jgi:hypothetical protein
MNNPQPMIPLLLLLLFVMQPIMLGIYVTRVHRPGGLLWGIVAFGMDIAVLVFFELHMAAHTIADMAAEVGIAIILSTLSILAILELLEDGPKVKAGEDPLINFRRGLFRIWIFISGSWLIYCTIVYLKSCSSLYACEFFTSGHNPVYLDIGTRLIGPPILAFLTGIVICWVVDGFKRSSSTEGNDPSTAEKEPDQLETRADLLTIRRGPTPDLD